MLLLYVELLSMTSRYEEPFKKFRIPVRISGRAGLIKGGTLLWLLFELVLIVEIVIYCKQRSKLQNILQSNSDTDVHNNKYE